MNIESKGGRVEEPSRREQFLGALEEVERDRRAVGLLLQTSSEH